MKAKTTKAIRQHGSIAPLTLAAALLAAAAPARAETPVQAWVQRYSGPGNSGGTPTAVVVDSSNNVIVTGFSVGSGGRFDYATLKSIPEAFA